MNFKSAQNNLIVLAYHKVENIKVFESQIIYLKNKYNFVGLDYLTEKNEITTNKIKVLLTFDDGDKSFYENAFPILKKHSVPAVIFIVTKLINTNIPFWWDEIEYYLGKELGNKKVWEVKEWENKIREGYIIKLRANSQKPKFEYLQLTSEQLKELDRYNIKIGNHSHTHPMFDKCEKQELELELDRSIEMLEELDLNPHVFAYPNGNTSLEVENLLKEKGVKFAFLFDHKIAGKIKNPMRISRLIVNDTTRIWKLKFIISGWHSKILPIIKMAAKLR